MQNSIIPADHLLRRLAAAVDFSFVGELVSDCYCPDNGRPSWDPLVLFKVVFLQFLYDLCDRQVEEQINLHLACKWFAGLQPEQTAPDHSTLCRFRSRLGPEKFEEIFNQIIQRARQAGLVNDRLRIIDATHLQAKADLFRLPQAPPETPCAEAPGSPDPDARFGRKSAKRSFYGYKEHLATDAESELITAVSVTPGNVADSEEFIGLVDPRARDVTADKGYDTNANHQRLRANGQRSSIILKQNRTNPQVIAHTHPQSQRERPNIERKFAEQKKYHGLAQARYWGLTRVTIQVLITCIVVNCKRMVRLLSAVAAGLLPAENAQVLAHAEGAPLLLTRTMGKGRAILLNFNFDNYLGPPRDAWPLGEECEVKRAVAWKEGAQFWCDLLEALGAEPGVRVLGPDGRHVAGIRRGLFSNGPERVLILACVPNLARGEAPGQVEASQPGPCTGARAGARHLPAGLRLGEAVLKLPTPCHIVDLRQGRYLGLRESVPLAVGTGRAFAFSLLPRWPGAMELRVPDTVRPGETFSFEARPPEGEGGKRVIRFTTIGPSGESCPWFSGRVVTEGSEALLNAVAAYNDSSGRYRVRATDVATTSATVATFEILPRD